MNLSQEANEKKDELQDKSELFYDTPLLHPDQDGLTRAPFAKTLAKSILQMDAKHGFVFALHGSWGSGKTSTLNFVLHYVEQMEDSACPVVLRFNPWWFSGREQLLMQFFKQFQAVLGHPDIPAKLKTVSTLLGAFSYALSPLEFIGVSPGWARKLICKIKDMIKKVEETSKVDVQAIRERINKSLLEQSSCILIVIDDIDRLTASEIKQMFQLVKAVADFPRTIYLLAFDRKTVIDALRDEQVADPEGYLEKIIQLPFDLPPPSKLKMRTVLAQQLEQALAGSPKELLDDLELRNIFWDGIDPFILTPRDVKRFINVVRSSYPSVKGEVNPSDFLGIQSLRLFAPPIYVSVATNKDLFAGYVDTGSYSSTKRDEVNKVYNSFLANVKEQDRDRAQDLLKRLFPKFAWGMGGAIYGPGWSGEWRRKLKVCSPEIFDTYFQLTPSPDMISAGEMSRILSLTSDNKVFADELLRLSKEKTTQGTTRVREFLERLLDYVEKDISENDIEPILRAIYSIGDQLLISEDEFGMFDIGNDMRLMRVTSRLLKRLPEQDSRFKLLENAMKDAQAVALIAHEVSLLGQEHGKYGNKKPTVSQDDRIVGTKHVELLEKIAVGNIRRVAQEDKLAKAPDLGFVLYRWIEWGTSEEVKNWVKNLISTDEGFAVYIEGFLQFSYSLGIGAGDRAARKIPRVHRPSVFKFAPVDERELLKRASRLLDDSPLWFSSRQKLALQAFVNPEKED